MTADNKPKVRFQGFEGQWEERKFEDNFSIVSGFAYKSKEYIPIGIPIINGEAIQHNLIKNINLNYLPKDYLDKYDKFILRTNDIVLGLNRPIINGNLKIAKIPQSLDMSLLYQRAGKVLISEFIDKKFTYVLLDIEISKFVSEEAVGSDQPFISTNKLNKWKLKTPSLQEQEQIGTLFELMDERIRLHKERKERMEEAKKSYMQKMFPKGAAKEPEMRFGGFEGEWEEIKFASFLNMYQPKTIASSDLKDNGFPVFGANGYIGFYDKYNHFEDEVTLSARGENTGIPNFVKGPSWITGNSMVMGIVDDNIDKYFLFSLLKSLNIKPYITGGAQPQLTKETLNGIKILIPSLPEQQLIGAFFQALDEKIQLEDAAIEQAERMKKASLQMLFV